MEHTIDATDKSLGRIATAAAVFLMGKDNPNFQRNVAPAVKVKILNASKAKITKKKMQEKTYQNYSGYPGGRKVFTMEKLVEKKGYEEVFRKAVRGMLPANKLRSVMMKNLIVTE
jgi:large subunit ribosomal protein L13